MWAYHAIHAHTSTIEQRSSEKQYRRSSSSSSQWLWWLPDAPVYTIGHVDFSGTVSTERVIYERKMFMLCLIELISHLSVAFVYCFVARFWGHSRWNEVHASKFGKIRRFTHFITLLTMVSVHFSSNSLEFSSEKWNSNNRNHKIHFSLHSSTFHFKQFLHFSGKSLDIRNSPEDSWMTQVKVKDDPEKGAKPNDNVNKE